MKRIFLSLALCLVGSLAQAQMSAAAACQRLTVYEYKVQCFEIINRSHYIDGFAVKACDRIQGQPETVSCMQAISNKMYSSYEVNACDSLPGAAETTMCFQRLGRYTQSTPYPPQHPQPIPQPIPQPYPSPYPSPTPSVYTCAVRELGGALIASNQFFSRSSQRAQLNHRCVIARISDQNYSGRIYDGNGQRVAREMGGLSVRTIEQVAANHGLYNCLRMTCDPRY